ncbi:MAG: metallophosphoesterase [Actinomycetota bacterium]
MRPVRLLHTSDVHLGSGGFPRPKHGEHLDECLCPLDAIAAAVDQHRPDLVVVAGDLFDHQRVTAELVDGVLDRLARLEPTCVLINGNHDLHDDRSLYPTGETLSADELVFLDRLDGHTVEVLDGAVHLWGKAMDDHHRGFRPLHGIPPRPRPDAWWVAVGHGHFEPTEDAASIRSSPLTSADIEATGADYVALGHWHVQTDVSTDSVTAWYSGAPYGFGATGRFNLVDLDPRTGTSVTPVEVQLPAQGCGPPTTG